MGKGKILLILCIIITPAESQGRKRRVDLKYGACNCLLISCCSASDYKIGITLYMIMMVVSSKLINKYNNYFRPQNFIIKIYFLNQAPISFHPK